MYERATHHAYHLARNVAVAAIDAMEAFFPLAGRLPGEKNPPTPPSHRKAVDALFEIRTALFADDVDYAIDFS